MPLESVLFLVLVIVALSVFAAVLVYAEWTTRQVARENAIAESPGAGLTPTRTAQPQSSNHIHDKAA